MTMHRLSKAFLVLLLFSGLAFAAEPGVYKRGSHTITHEAKAPAGMLKNRFRKDTDTSSWQYCNGSSPTDVQDSEDHEVGGKLYRVRNGNVQVKLNGAWRHMNLVKEKGLG